MTVRLFWLTGEGDEPAPAWSLGPCTSEARDARSVARAASARATSADPDELWLFWDARLGPPSPEAITAAAQEPGEAFHAGLLLGQGGRPGLMDFVHPTWMLQRDPPTDRPASSWRLSLRACLVPAEVWTRCGGPFEDFDDLDAASLELGHRWWRSGVLLRHVPGLLDGQNPPPSPEPGPLDEMRLLRRTTSSFWCAWALARALLTGSGPRISRVRAFVVARDLRPPALPACEDQAPDSGFRPRASAERPGGRARSATCLSLRKPLGPQAPAPKQPKSSSETSREFEHRAPNAGPTLERSGTEPGLELSEQLPSVAVLIPTLDRYPYLRVVLDQLRTQTVAPAEIVVVDQSPASSRPAGWQEEFADLPLRVIEQEIPGQSTARNAGLRTIVSDRVLFLDDDVEIEPDLVARHLETLDRFRADASCGVTEEVGAGPLPEGFRRRRTSDVFPTCNCMIRRGILELSGLFDLAFDHGSRADADLGTRIYLAGGLMVLEPSISVLHHKAPSGGLRRHRARVVTYADSRRRLWARHLPSATELYLAERYFTPRQVREAGIIRIAATLRGGGGRAARLLKVLVGLAQLPDTLLQVRQARRRADELLGRYPDIPELETPGRSSEEASSEET